MSVDIKTLYRVVGEEEPILKQRVEEAVAWLLSPKAEGIGEKLLRDAHALHGKPITIVASSVKETEYCNEFGEHAIIVNPKHLSGVTLKAEDGTAHVMSVERTLGHELTHAGQEGVVETEKNLKFIPLRAEAKAMEGFFEEEFTEDIEKAADAPDYHTARRHVANYVDKIDLPMNAEMLRHIHADPEFVHYVKTFEEPAMAVENRIATIRGEPIRADYTHAPDIEPATLREMAIDKRMKEWGLDSKPVVDLSQQSWAAKVAKSAGWRRE